MVCGGWHFQLGCLQKFLESFIDKAGDLASNQVTWLGKKFHSTALCNFFDGRGASVLLHEDAVGRGRDIKDFKAIASKQAHRLFISSFYRLLGHLPLLPPEPFHAKRVA